MLDTRLAAFCTSSPLPEAMLLHTGMVPAAKRVHSREWATFSRTSVKLPRDPEQGPGCRMRIMKWEQVETHGDIVHLDTQENLGRWRDPKDALRRAVTSQWSPYIPCNLCNNYSEVVTRL